MLLLHAATFAVVSEILLMCGLATAESTPKPLLRRDPKENRDGLSKEISTGPLTKDSLENKHKMVIEANGFIQGDNAKKSDRVHDVQQVRVHDLSWGTAGERGGARHLEETKQVNVIDHSIVTEGTKDSFLQLDHINENKKEGQFFVLRHHSGMCVTMDPHTSQLVLTYKCDTSSANQLFERVESENGNFQFKPKAFPACVVANDDDSHTALGFDLDCPSQQSTFKEVGQNNGQFVLQNQNGKCIQPRGASMYPAEYTSHALTTDCASHPAMLFKWVPEQAAIQQVKPYFVLKHTGGNCVTKSSSNDLILTDKCDTSSDLQLFQKQDAGSGFFLLNFKNSKDCIHPFGGATQPEDNTKLTAWPECPQEDKVMLKEYAATKDGYFSLQLKSGSCVHANGGFSSPPDSTNLVYFNECSTADKMRFKLVPEG